MTCASCGASNRAQAHFCDGCGAKLVARAALPSAGEPRVYTPQHLAERILRSRSALEGERKQVTVLFADVRESMQLSESLGIETWHATLDRFFQVLAEGVHRFEGTINQYTGDGVMALFGAPLALEDHAERACACALSLREPLRRLAHELRRAHGVDFAVRMGLHSGEVVVGKIGDDLRMDYTAQGPVVGTAQRIEQLAETGRPYLSEATARLVEGYFALEDQGELALKGVRAPMRVFALDGEGPLHSRLERARRRGFSRFVGRARELSALEGALGDAQAAARRFAIVGDAGSGKSRLCHELAVRASARGARVVTAHCTARSDLPLVPVRELLAGLVGLRHGDESLAARRKIAGALLLADPDLQPRLPGIFTFFGVADPAQQAPPVEPGSLQEQLVRIAELLLRTASEREIVLVLIEDTHWCDSLSESVLGRLRDRSPRRALLWVENARPGASESLLRGAERLELAPLDDSAVDELLADLLGADPALAELKTEVRERAAGNPFFVEELVLSLVESGVLVGDPGQRSLGRSAPAPVLPATVQAVLAARIDRLGEREKALLGLAAVIGRDVPESLLSELCALDGPTFSQACAELAQAELLLEAAQAPERVLRFKHPLTQEVAYGQQLAAARARLHAAVARVLARDAEEAPEALAAIVSDHFERAGETVAAARWLMRAALASERHDARHAAERWRRAYDSLSALSTTPATEELAIEAALGALVSGFYAQPGVSPEALRQLADEALARAERLGSQSALSALHTHAALLALLARDLERVLSHSDRALDHAERSGDRRLRDAVRGRLAYSDLYSRGERETLRRIDEALAAGPVADLVDPRWGLRDSPRLRLLVFRAYALAGVGRPSEAEALFSEVLGAAVDGGHLATEFAAQIGRTALLRLLGNGDASLALGRQVIERADAVGAAYWRQGAEIACVQAQALMGDWSAALAGCDRLLRGPTFRGSTAALRALRVEALVRTGDVPRARALLAELEAQFGIAFNDEQFGPTVPVSPRLSLTRARLALDGVSARPAVEALLDAQAERELRHGSPVSDAYIALERAELARVLGDESGWRGHLEIALRGFASGPVPRLVEWTNRQLARGFAATQR
ncbi:MAG: AAA family ATPase [Myxococcota bacterium]